jgi:hypothetical protein
MDAATLSIIIAIVGAVIQYGVPAVQSAIAALGKDEITIEDIQNLKITKEPGEF